MTGHISVMLIVVLAILAVSMIRGWRRGFLGVLFSLVSVIVLIILIARFTPKISAFLQDNTKIYERVETSCVERVEDWLETSSGEDEEPSLLPRVIERYLDIDAKDLVKLEEGTQEAQQSVRELLAQEIGGRLAHAILSGAVFLIALILAIIVIKVIEHLLKLVNKIPILGAINRGLGILAGGFEGLIIVWVIFMAVSLFAGAGSEGPVIRQIEGNIFLSFLYQNNLLWQLLQGALGLS